jgi:hypothetical protein
MLALARGYGLSPPISFRLSERSSVRAREEEEPCAPEIAVKHLREAITEAKPLAMCRVRPTGDRPWIA